MRSLARIVLSVATLTSAACSKDAMSRAADASLPGAPDGAPGAPDAAAPDAATPPQTCARGGSGNPFVEGWYADPDMKVYDGEYWVYPTTSAPYDQQTYLDAFSSPDLIHWTKHARVLDRANVTWATRAIWAPSPIEKDGTYYLFFGANDIQSNSQEGGIGVATASHPEGPFVDAIGHPLIGQFANGAQPIDQNVFIDDDGQAYLYYGGWGHCNVVKLNPDLTSLGTFADGTTYKEITPAGYVEGALMFKRQGGYYLIWSEGGWTGPDYRVAYARATSPTGPFVELGTILSQDAQVATGSGHNTVVNVPGTDEWYIFYHRHPLGETDGNHRVLAYDRMIFEADGTIRPVKMETRDDFCDGNAIGWTARGGTWSVTAGRYGVVAANDARATLNDDFGLVDVSARVTVGATGDAGVLVRATSLPGGGYDGYYAGLDAANDRVFLGKANGSSFTLLSVAGRPLAAGEDHLLRVVASGHEVSVYLDGASNAVASAIDSDFASGQTGLVARATTASFDDVSVSAVPATSVIFYQDGGFGGASVALGPGAYELAQLTAAGLPEDWMSSLRMPTGWTVEVYADDHFGGTRWTFTADAATIPADANDAMSSVKILAP